MFVFLFSFLPGTLACASDERHFLFSGRLVSIILDIPYQALCSLYYVGLMDLGAENDVVKPFAVAE